jgi:hypothetical protein
MLVTVPVTVPLTTTFTPIKGSFVSLSVIVPLTVVWPFAQMEMKKRGISNNERVDVFLMLTRIEFTKLCGRPDRKESPFTIPNISKILRYCFINL